MPEHAHPAQLRTSDIKSMNGAQTMTMKCACSWAVTVQVDGSDRSIENTATYDGLNCTKYTSNDEENAMLSQISTLVTS